MGSTFSLLYVKFQILLLNAIKYFCTTALQGPQFLSYMDCRATIYIQGPGIYVKQYVKNGFFEASALEQVTGVEPTSWCLLRPLFILLQSCSSSFFSLVLVALHTPPRRAGDLDGWVLLSGTLTLLSQLHPKVTPGLLDCGA